MIIKGKNEKDYCILDDSSSYVSLHEYNPSEYTQARITTVCYGSNNNWHHVVITTFSEGRWDTSVYVTDEVYKETFSKILGFIAQGSRI